MPPDGVHDAQAVGADDADAVAAGCLEDLALELDALGPDLLEPGADDDHALDAGLAALLDEAGGGLGRGHDDGEVDRLPDRADRRVGLDAQDRGPGGVHRVDRAAERRRQQVPQDGAADRPLLLRGADDGDRAGMEDRIERLALLRVVDGGARRGEGGHRDPRIVHGRGGTRDWQRDVKGGPAGVSAQRATRRIRHPNRPVRQGPLARRGGAGRGAGPGRAARGLSRGNP